MQPCSDLEGMLDLLVRHEPAEHADRRHAAARLRLHRVRYVDPVVHHLHSIRSYAQDREVIATGLRDRHVSPAVHARRGPRLQPPPQTPTPAGVDDLPLLAMHVMYERHDAPPAHQW